MHRMWDPGFNNMMDFGSRFGGWFILYSILRLLVIVVVVIILARMLIKYSKNKDSSYSRPNKAVEILKERYALGEISEEEYKNKLDKLNE